jgi:hypothetical protein
MFLIGLRTLHFKAEEINNKYTDPLKENGKKIQFVWPNSQLGTFIFYYKNRLALA